MSSGFSVDPGILLLGALLLVGLDELMTLR